MEANFTNVVATDFALFNYDAAMAICLAACEAEVDHYGEKEGHKHVPVLLSLVRKCEAPSQEHAIWGNKRSSSHKRP